MNNIYENKRFIAGMIDDVVEESSPHQNHWVPDGEEVPEGFLMNDTGL